MQDAVDIWIIQNLSILTLTFNCSFLCALDLEKQKMPQCNYVLIKLPNFVLY